MKILYRVLALLLLVAHHTEGSNEMITTQYNNTNLKGLSESSAVTFSTPGLLTITQGNTASLEITAPDEVLDRLVVTVEAERLSIVLPKRLLGLTRDYVKAQLTLPSLQEVSAEGSASLNINPFNGESLQVKGDGSGDIHMEAVEFESLQIVLNGSGHFRSNRIEAKQVSLKRSGSCEAWLGAVSSQVFDLWSKGSGDIHISEINAPEARFTLDGNGDVNIAKGGTASQKTVTVKGAANFYGRNLLAQETTADLNGSGVIEVHAQNHIKAELFGSGEIRYFGSPTIVKTQVKGSGAISSGETLEKPMPLAAN